MSVTELSNARFVGKEKTRLNSLEAVLECHHIHQHIHLGPL